MAKRTVPTRHASRPVQYIDRYSDPARVARVGEVTIVTPAQLARRRAQQREEYLVWRAKQDELAERDRKVRRFLLGLGLALGTGLLAGLGVAGWLVYHAIATAGTGLIAVPLVLLGVAALAVGGHRCVTIVQHWH
jgi:hypothetical protein